MSTTCWQTAIPKGWTIPMDKEYAEIFAPNRAEITVDDNGGGRYLRVEFINDETDLGTGENPHQGFFCTHDDINEFSARLHEMLDAAQVGEKKDENPNK